MKIAPFPWVSLLSLTACAGQPTATGPASETATLAVHSAAAATPEPAVAAVEAELQLTWCTFEPAIAQLKDVHVTPEHAYVLETDKVTRWRMDGVRQGACAPQLDPTFGTDGSIALTNEWEDVSPLGDGHLLLSDGLDAEIVDSTGKQRISCGAFATRVATDGKTIYGLRWEGDNVRRLVRGQLEGEECKLTVWGPKLPDRTVRTTAVVGEHFVVAATSENPGDVVVGYDSAGKEAFRFGAPTSEMRGFISLGNHVMSCPGGICALDAKGEGFTVWSTSGALIAEVPIDPRAFSAFDGASRGGNFVAGVGYFGVHDKNTMLRIDHFEQVVAAAR